MATPVSNAGVLFDSNGKLCKEQLPRHVIDELTEVIHQQKPQAPPLPPRDEDVDQPVAVPEQQVPAPPQSSGWGWKVAYGLSPTLGLLGVGLVAAAHGATKVYGWATAPREDEQEVAE